MATSTKLRKDPTVQLSSNNTVVMPAVNGSRNGGNTSSIGLKSSSRPVRSQSAKNLLSEEVIDNGMKNNGYRADSVVNQKHLNNSVNEQLQKKDVGSVKKSCRTVRGNSVLENSLDNMASLKQALEEDVTEDERSGVLVKDSSGSSVKSDGCETGNDCRLDQCLVVEEQPIGGLASDIPTNKYKSPPDSCWNGSQYMEAKDSFGTTGVSESASVDKSSGSTKVSNSCDFVESTKTSTCRGSTGSDISDESSLTSYSSTVNKPHKGNDTRWDAIQAVRSRDGVLGINHFRLLKRLGCGDIGSVYLSELSRTNTYFALKVMDKVALASRKKLPRAQTEKEILQCLDHPFLPTLYSHFETEKFSCLVMEFCPGGDLHALRQRQPGKHFSENAARFYVAEVLLAMEYLHMLGIIYRDLKPENVLVRDDGHIMLSDFDLSLRCVVSPTLVKSSNTELGLSKKNSSYCVQPACIEPTCVIQPACMQPTCFGPRFFSSKPKKDKKSKPKNETFTNVSHLPELLAEPTSARSMSFVGTHEYLAPEIIKGEGHGSAVDWWTFGIFLYELLYGKTPFKGSGNRATLFNVVGQPLRFPETPTVSFAARDLIRGLLVKEPQHRLAYRRGATEIKQHPFFQSVNWALIRCTSPPDVPKPQNMDFSAPNETPAASKTENGSGVDVKPSGNYLEIDFF